MAHPSKLAPIVGDLSADNPGKQEALVDLTFLRFPHIDPVSSAKNCDEALCFDDTLDWPYVRVRLDGADIPSTRGWGCVRLATTPSGKRVGEDILPREKYGLGGRHNALVGLSTYNLLH